MHFCGHHSGDLCRSPPGRRRGKWDLWFVVIVVRQLCDCLELCDCVLGSMEFRICHANPANRTAVHNSGYANTHDINSLRRDHFSGSVSRFGRVPSVVVVLDLSSVLCGYRKLNPLPYIGLISRHLYRGHRSRERNVRRPDWSHKIVAKLADT